MLSTTISNKHIEYFENWSLRNIITRTIEEAEIYLDQNEPNNALLVFFD
jgi:hypothetical protein